MKIATMKLLDHKVGLVICLVLDIFERAMKLIMRLKRISIVISEPKNIVITKYFGMGSIILATPMIRAIKQKYPQAKITILTFAGKKDLLDLITEIDEVIELRTKNLFIFSKDLFLILSQLRKRNIDIIIDLEFFSKFSTMVAYLAGAKIRVGYYVHHMWRGNLLTHHAYYNHYRHITEIFMALAHSIGADADNLDTYLVNKEKDNIWQKLIEYGLEETDQLVTINVNASDLCLERRWPAKDFISLISTLASKYADIKFVFIGSEQERRYVNRIFRHLSPKYKNVINLVGKLDLKELMGLLENSRLFIGNDSGPLHIAVALKTPSVSFFGPETPVLYGPKGTEHIVFYKGFYCSPCLNVYNMKTASCSGDNKCMQAITTEEVLEAVCLQLDKKTKR